MFVPTVWQRRLVFGPAPRRGPATLPLRVRRRRAVVVVRQRGDLVYRSDALCPLDVVNGFESGGRFTQFGVASVRSHGGEFARQCRACGVILGCVQSCLEVLDVGVRCGVGADVAGDTTAAAARQSRPKQHHNGRKQHHDGRGTCSRPRRDRRGAGRTHLGWEVHSRRTRCHS